MGVPLRKNVQFQLLWFGGAVNQLGSQLTTLALPLVVWAITGSSALAGIVVGTRLVALIITQMPAGVLVDRWDRRRILVWSQTAQAVVAAGLAFSLYTDSASLPVFLAAAALDGACTAFVGPARSTAIKAVVPEGQLRTAFAQEEARIHAAGLAGPPLGGLLLQTGRALPFAVDALTYLVAAVCAWFVRIPPRVDVRPRQKMKHELKEAGTWLWRRPGLRNITIGFLVLNLLGTASMLPVMVLVKERGGSEALVGLVLAGIGVGGVIGALISTRIRFAPGPLMVGVMVIFGLCNASMALPFGAVWPFVPLMITALTTPSLNIVVSAVYTTLVPDEMLGRMDAVLNFATRVLMPLGPVVGGFLAAGFGGAVTLVVTGSAILLTALVVAFTDTSTASVSA